MKNLYDIYEGIFDDDYEDNLYLDQFIKDPFRTLVNNTREQVKTLDDWNEMIRTFAAATKGGGKSDPQVWILASNPRGQAAVHIESGKYNILLRSGANEPNKFKAVLDLDSSVRDMYYTVVDSYNLNPKYTKEFQKMVRAWKNLRKTEDGTQWLKWKSGK